MATLEDNRPLIADLLDGLGMAAGAASLRHAAALDAVLSPDLMAELECLREAVDAVRSALEAKGSAASKLAAIRAALPVDLYAGCGIVQA